MDKLCTNCAVLHVCNLVDVQKLSTPFHCSAWEKASDPEIAANDSVIRDFGAWALSYDVLPLQARAVDHKLKHRRRHTNG